LLDSILKSISIW